MTVPYYRAQTALTMLMLQIVADRLLIRMRLPNLDRSLLVRVDFIQRKKSRSGSKQQTMMCVCVCRVEKARTMHGVYIFAPASKMFGNDNKRNDRKMNGECISVAMFVVVVVIVGCEGARTHCQRDECRRKSDDPTKANSQKIRIKKTKNFLKRQEKYGVEQ